MNKDYYISQLVLELTQEEQSDLDISLMVPKLQAFLKERKINIQKLLESLPRMSSLSLRGNTLYLVINGGFSWYRIDLPTPQKKAKRGRR